MNIKEDYVSFEVAKLLKEKGFHEPCIATYNLTTKSFDVEEIYQDWTTCWKTCVSAPTLHIACKWLREVYYLHICVQPLVECGYTAYIYDVADKDDYGIIQSIPHHKTYEEAVEAALKFTLENLI